MKPTTPNPGILKLDLAIQGARLDPSVRRRSEVFRIPWLREHVTRSVEVLLPEAIWVNVPIGEHFTENSPYVLLANGNGFGLTRDAESLDVIVVSQPEYYTHKTRAGTPMWAVGTAYGGYMAIDPARGCRFGPLGVPCRFCDLVGQGGTGENPLSVADVIETLRAGFAEGVVESVYLHIGYMEGEDAGIRFLEPYVSAIKKHFDTLVAVQLQPPKKHEWIARTYAMGVDALSYSVQIHDPDLLKKYCPGRVDIVGREHYYDALAHAASIFPSGTVWSDFIVGLEPQESTIAGIDVLVQAGVLPVLSLFRPLDGTLLRDHPLPSPAEVEPVFAHLFHAVRKAKINMNWVRDLSFAITPLEARYFAGEDARAPGNSQFYRSRLGTIATRSLSRLRRQLRVRTVGDSFDSSNL